MTDIKLRGIQGSRKIWPAVRKEKKKSIETELEMIQMIMSKDIKMFIITIFRMLKKGNETVSVFR